VIQSICLTDNDGNTDLRNLEEILVLVNFDAVATLAIVTVFVIFFSTRNFSSLTTLLAELAVGFSSTSERLTEVSLFQKWTINSTTTVVSILRWCLGLYRFLSEQPTLSLE
jgi:hypothetical protein